ncbi:MAG TPA: L-histidine N(alpha)-methyltransferase [Longimicrobiales bacterium]|nr:L-histidine N(alpha)-methyltransferase [Longimicrobiales bacterium]
MSDAEELRQLAAGLAAPQKHVDSKYFYDQRGSELFDEITTLAEYYPTRTEVRLLERWAAPLVEQVGPSALLELGAGSARKTRLLLGPLERVSPGATYIPLDVSDVFLAETARELRAEFPRLRVTPLVGDFTRDIELREPLPRPALFALLGSTIGNFDDERAIGILSHVTEHMRSGDRLLLGVDLRPGPTKPKEELEAAYNDGRGVTEEFNLNLLRVLNDRYATDFDPSDFEHVAFYDDARHRIEMHLKARRASTVLVPGVGTVDFESGETLRTEISRKYDRVGIESIFRRSGLEIAEWLDADDRYALAVGRVRT